VEFTPGCDGDFYVLPELLSHLPEGEKIGTVTAPSRGLPASRCRATDGVYDTRRCHSAITDQKANAIILIRKNGGPGKEDCPAAIAKNETLRATRHSGRTFWKRWTGYQARSRVKPKMPTQILAPVALNLLDLRAFGERLSARDLDRQNPDPRRRHQPLHCTRYRQDFPYGQGSMDKSEVLSQA
jgi:hypothetical protein